MEMVVLNRKDLQDEIRRVTASQRQDIKKKWLRAEEVVEFLALKNKRQLTELQKDKNNCKLEKTLIPNTYTVASVLREQERLLNFK
jgi:hypothetical protein